MRFVGWFQGLELAIYDRFWSMKAIAQWDNTIVLVGYDDDDEAKYGHYIPDHVLTQVLKKVERGNPALVGLSLTRRDAPENINDRQQLEAQMEAMGNFSDPLKEKLYKTKCIQEKKKCSQLLFQVSEEETFPKEPDSVQRKAKLYRDDDYSGFRINPNRNRHFAWELVFQYLKNKEATINEPASIYSPITITYPKGDTSPKEETVKIYPLSPRKDGGYNANFLDLKNFQVLISWIKESTPELRYFSFKKILNSPPKDFEGKIILIGPIAQSYQANADLPVYGQKDVYTKRYHTEIIGIVVGNLLNQAETPFVQVWNDEQEYLFLCLWMIISGILVEFIGKQLKSKYNWLKFTFKIIIVWFILIGLIGFISFRAFPYWWIPPGFIWVGLTANIVLCGMTNLGIQLGIEQQNTLDEKNKRIKEQEKRLKQKEILEQEKDREIAELKETLLAKERLAFFGKLAPFIQHRTLGLYDLFALNITAQNKKLTNLEVEFDTILEILEEQNTINENEIENYKSEILNFINYVRDRGKDQRDILKRGSELLNRFLPIFRHNNERYINPETIDFKEIVKESIRINKYDFDLNKQNFNVKLEIDTDEELPSIRGIPSELEFALINVIENAYYAVWEKSNTEQDNYEPTVKIKTERFKENKIQVIIMDNGVGLPKNKDKVFLPFYSTKQKFQKTGLGLTLTKDMLVENYQGNIKCETIDDWTYFILELGSSQ
ncbi:MAG: CHASE2 domain-containing protein [Crocosphaera sp.]|nr:CHASE2 domain-containing protein [Crocosphaera sp.]